MTAPTEVRKRVHELVDKLPKDLLLEAVEFLEFLCIKANQVRASAASRPKKSALL